MISLNPETINSRIQDGYKFDFGKYLSEGFEVFTKQWLNFSLFTLVTFIISIFSIITIIGPVVVYVASMIGYGIVSEKVKNNEPVNFSDFFKGYDKLGQLIVYALLQIGLTLILLIPFFILYVLTMGSIINNPDDSGLAPIFAIVMFIYYPIMYLGIFLISGSLFFSVYLIYYGNYSAFDAMKISYKLFKKNWLFILLFILLMGIIGNIGMILCFVGIFASLSIVGICYYMAVRDIILTDNVSEIDEIGLVN